MRAVAISTEKRKHRHQNRQHHHKRQPGNHQRTGRIASTSIGVIFFVRAAAAALRSPFDGETNVVKESFSGFLLLVTTFEAGGVGRKSSHAVHKIDVAITAVAVPCLGHTQVMSSAAFIIFITARLGSILA